MHGAAVREDGGGVERKRERERRRANKNRRRMQANKHSTTYRQREGGSHIGPNTMQTGMHLEPRAHRALAMRLDLTRGFKAVPEASLLHCVRKDSRARHGSL
jgi:hypothetical protein